MDGLDNFKEVNWKSRVFEGKYDNRYEGIGKYRSRKINSDSHKSNRKK